METERGTTQEFNRFPFVRDLHEIQPVFPEADFGLGITSGLPVTRPGRSITSGLVDEDSYSARSASEGDIRLARTAGTNAATSVEKLSVRMARRVVAGSYGFKP